MAACSTQHRNKWEDQKIKKFYIKKHKGVATRQHKFPKLSSNSAHPFVRNWAKISKLQCRVNHKNHCNAFSQHIQKYPKSLNTEIVNIIYNNINTDLNIDDSTAFSSTDVTLGQYLDPILSQYNDRCDEYLQIAIQQSYDTYNQSQSKPRISHGKRTRKHRQTSKFIRETDNETLIMQKQQREDNTQDVDVKVDLKVTIQVHNILDVDYNTISHKEYITSINKQQHRLPHCRWHNHYKPLKCIYYKYNALPYILKECNMEIRIDDEIYSYCFTPETSAEYTVIIDEKRYSFQGTEYERGLMNVDQIIPIYFQKRNHIYCPHSNDTENHRLLQIAQKCFENVIQKNKNIYCLPQWKYNAKHCKNNAFFPSICKLKDILSESIPIHEDIIHGVLIPYIGCSTFECVVIESTMNIPSQHKDILLQNTVQSDIKLNTGTIHGVKCITPFSNNSGITYIAPQMVYSYNDIKYDSRQNNECGYTKQHSKKCKQVSKTNTNYFGRVVTKYEVHDSNTMVWTQNAKGRGCQVKINELNDGIYDEKQRRKDLKRRNVKGKVRKRRNRKYLIKPMVKHRRRKERKKKFRKSVHHPMTAKQKRFKSKISKALQLEHGHWSNIYYWRGYSYQPNYCNEYDKLKPWSEPHSRYAVPRYGRKHPRA